MTPVEVQSRLAELSCSLLLAQGFRVKRKGTLYRKVEDC